MQTDISIVVVHWNVPELLGACLRSIEFERARSALTVQTVVVDTASPDRSYREIVGHNTAVELVELTENRGYAAGCNAGIRHSSGEAILLLNADTELLPGSLDGLWQGLHITAHIGMVGPLLLNADGSVQSSGYHFASIANVFFDLFPLHPRLIESPLNGRLAVSDGVQPLKADYILGAAMMLRRETIEQIGGLDESYGMYSEEVDLARRVAEAGWTTLVVPRARVIHHGGRSTSQRPLAMHEALWRSRAQYVRRWEPPRRQRAIGTVARLGLRLDDLRADPFRREVNARIREQLAVLGGRAP
jgi:N-acetylglucosaminyl-diphospho-decaprenol L-rhamnosyltransferase